MYAIGGNESAAEVSGVNTRLSKIYIYVIAGVMCSRFIAVARATYSFDDFVLSHSSKY